MKRLVRLYLIFWVLVFVASFLTADDIQLPMRLLCATVMACIPPLLSLGKSGASRNSKPKVKTANHSKYTIHKPFDPHVLYRIENGKVYQGCNVAPFLEIKGDKVYQANSSRFVYRIEKSKIYEGTKPAPFLEIRDSKLYPPSSSKPLYEIKEAK